MYKIPKTPSTDLNVNQSVEGETIEEKIRRIVNNNEPISDGAPLVYTERKGGVAPEHDIRTDRWELAIDAMDKVAKSHVAKRDSGSENIGEEAKKGMEIEAKEGQKGVE